MRRALIVQARMTSTRLPGKVMMDLAGRPMLEQQVRRLQRCTRADVIVIATTTNTTDDIVAALALKLGTECYRGSEYDVLGRYLGAARQSRADVVARITADCPLIEPAVVDRVLEDLTAHADSCDYVSNTLQRSFPRGLDVEALFLDSLQRIGRMAASAPAREHVTYFLTTERRDLFSVRSVTDSRDNSDLHWTVDTAEDLATVRAIYDALNLDEQILSYDEVLEHVRSTSTAIGEDDTSEGPNGHAPARPSSC